MLPIIKLVIISITKNIVTFSVIKTIGIRTIYRRIIKFNRRIIDNQNTEMKVNNVIKYFIRLPQRIFRVFK